MTASTVPPLHVLRSILRNLSKGDSSTRAHVLKQYRASQTISSPSRVTALRKLAYDYSILQRDLAERARLHELDSGAEVKLSPKEQSRLAAARAGLQLPKLNPELQD